MTIEDQPAIAPGSDRQQRHGERYVYGFDEPPRLPADELRQLLGGKGAGLVEMAHRLRLPVPPGFVISSEACQYYMAAGWPSGLDDELRTHLERLGERVGRRFGDAADPLLVSVRSGAAVSMPGMMDTLLNVGLTEATTAGLAAVTGDDTFADDCLRRLRQGYRDVIDRRQVPDDPWLQLRSAIEAVFRSWDSERARTYRRLEQIPDDLGTAVTVQAMVFGNRGPDSGTGVLFTRNPATGEQFLYGDVMFNAQGEDVVAGSHEPQPLSTLEERLPAVAAELRRHAELLERHYADLCDVEFTIEQGRLWLLQVRVGKRSPRAALRMALDMAEEPGFPLSREEAVRRVAGHLADPPRTFVRSGAEAAPIATGLPASPGVASGAIVTSAEAAERAADAGESVILVRWETSPEDVRGMARAAGVLTARGGLASHAAVVARGWGIPAVVGAAAVRPTDESVEIAGRRFEIGARITIDGSTGEIHAGELAGRWQVVPEAATLLGWAAELGIPIEGAATTSDGEAREDRAEEAPGTARSWRTEPSADDVLRALLIKSHATREQLTDALLCDDDAVEQLAGRLAADGLVEQAHGGFRLSPAGRLKAADELGAERAAFGESQAVEALEAFGSLDRRMKELVTAWQMRDVAGEQVFNDHTDGAYDAEVLNRLSALHSETVDWLSPLAAALARFELYRARLTRAVERARQGDQRFVASPRVDSYHSVWFELHEELLRLAGRRRSEEAV